MAVEYVAEFVENLLETCTVRPTVLRCLSFKVLRRQELVLASVIHAYMTYQASAADRYAEIAGLDIDGRILHAAS